MAWNDEVKEWIINNNSSIQKLSEKTGINAKSLSDYLRGRIQTLPDEKRKSLYEVTNLDVLAKPVGKIDYNPVKKKINAEGKTKEKIIEKENIEDVFFKNLSWIEERIIQMKDTCQKKAPLKEEYAGKIKEISDMFYNMIEKMDYLKQANAQEREKLTKAIDAKDMGYFMSFMNAIYKPDTFSTWLMSAGYTAKRREKK